MNKLVRGFIEWGMSCWRRFTVGDAAAFKICLLSVGTLFGASLERRLRRWIPLVWLTAILSYGYLIWRLMFVHGKRTIS